MMKRRSFFSWMVGALAAAFVSKKPKFSQAEGRMTIEIDRDELCAKVIAGIPDVLRLHGFCPPDESKTPS